VSEAPGSSSDVPAVAPSPLVGRVARTDSFEEQRKSTFAKVAEQVDAEDGARALDLLRFCRDQECEFIRTIMAEWRQKLRELIRQRGADEEAIEEADDRLAAVLAYPDGSPFDAEEGGGRLDAAFARVSEALQAAAWSDAREALQAAFLTWRQVHDREIDSAYGWMTEFVRRHGEAAVPEMWEAIGRGHFQEFFELADPERRSWIGEGRDAVVLDTLEAMRVHLSTPERDGAPIDVEERDDRWIFTFDPCGSGGRAVRGDWNEGTPSRIEPPYEFARIEGAYPWTDGKAGICVYCNHCQQIYEQWTMDEAGWPFFVVEPPVYPDNDPDEARRQRCSYTIYKDPASVPASIYERSGRTKPTHLEDGRTNGD
jgi:hypothetical protein